MAVRAQRDRVAYAVGSAIKKVLNMMDFKKGAAVCANERCGLPATFTNALGVLEYPFLYALGAGKSHDSGGRLFRVKNAHWRFILLRCSDLDQLKRSKCNGPLFAYS